MKEIITKAEIAEGYDKITDKIGLEAGFYDECLAVNRHYYGKILDIGCGRGFLLKKLREKVKPESRLFGLDISKKLCEIAKANNPDAEIILGDAEEMPFENNYFDFVFMTEVLDLVTISSTSPYFFASSASIKKSLSTSFSICARDLPVFLARSLFKLSLVFKICLAVMAISVAWPSTPPRG